MSKLIMWSLFDSGKGAYRRTVDKYFIDMIENYSIGIDKENEGDCFMNLNLADYGELFGQNDMWNGLDSLPKPDIILASPPCESWSVASSMRGGNRCYKWKGHPLSPRPDWELEEHNKKGYYPCYPWKVLYTRINGELCAYNTIRIIEKYNPKYWVIENPLSSHIWAYLEEFHNFSGVLNKAHYYAYNENFSLKPTGFMSNAVLKLKMCKAGTKANVMIGRHRGDTRPVVATYNQRSDIPEELVKDILDQILAGPVMALKEGKR